MKLFVGAFLNAFELAAPARRSPSALAIIAELYRTGGRRLPDRVPLRFVPPAWRPFVLRMASLIVPLMNPEAALSQLRERLRAGDIWVAGSRQSRFRHIHTGDTFAALREKGPLPLAIETDFERHIEERRTRLDTAIKQVTVPRQGSCPRLLDERISSSRRRRQHRPPGLPVAPPMIDCRA